MKNENTSLTVEQAIFDNHALGKVLHLTLKKKWFDMILSGEKKEEYRELNIYWFTRFVFKVKDVIKYFFPYSKPTDHDIKLICIDSFWKTTFGFNQYDYVHFYNGGSPCLKYPNFIIECKGIDIGKADPEWSDNLQGETFILKLGAILIDHGLAVDINTL